MSRDGLQIADTDGRMFEMKLRNIELAIGNFKIPLLRLNKNKLIQWCLTFVKKKKVCEPLENFQLSQQINCLIID